MSTLTFILATIATAMKLNYLLTVALVAAGITSITLDYGGTSANKPKSSQVQPLPRILHSQYAVTFHLSSFLLTKDYL